MADQHRWLVRLTHELAKQGWHCRQGGKHFIAYPADKKYKPIVISVTPSGRYGQVNAIRDLKKAGARI